MKDIEKYTEKSFERIKHIDEQGDEFWLARELMPLLEYGKWDNFHKVIKQAMISCKNCGIDICEQFSEVGKLSINVNGGTMSEDLPTPEKSLRQLEKQNKKLTTKE